MIELVNINIELPEFSVKDVSLHVAEGEFFALLGPTGAGKTLLLEAIAGIVPVTSGNIRIRGVDVTHMPPEHRNVGIVYQDLGLFPHLSVMENTVYGLRYYRSEPNAVKQQEHVDGLIRMLGLQHLVNRSTINLSGGEKQRVALARCLAVSPSVVLLDEPLSALDWNKRDEVLRLLKDVHENLGTTFLMVTHDFSQVAFLAQRAAVINKGTLEQVGLLSEVFQRPQSDFVAEFVGMKNLWPASFDNCTATVKDLKIHLVDPNPGNWKSVAIRPENIRLGFNQSESTGTNTFQAVVRGCLDVGPYSEVLVETEGVPFWVFVTKSALLEMGLTQGTNVCIAFDPASVHAF